MAKVRLTRIELKRQKDNLRRFLRYLPTLELKKQQLLQEIRSLQRTREALVADIERVNGEVRQWADVFAEEVGLPGLVRVAEVVTDTGNIAGIDIPLFSSIRFEDVPYDLFTTPLWVDRAIAVCKEQIERRVRLGILERQLAILQEELRVTIQRIKLFEEIKIPEAQENIRVIQIFLGDQMTAEVVRGKIAKAKIEKRREQ
ncbi:MAG: V-type ATP synthase subunit D [candidate division KSB1 bacterium]|nr:V-type ATP synthase subunit D [candidate division KSB1 bacterium]MDZ7379346.1 V-type ATP synthase subunit D [candidate division KSB1 bacterium]MDZ7385659.1 V-type ATP synthase subunit D [candidate division KSB1 bacterium]MDZ7394127.1 V-type ATP synthase subunit D [candidate division KSB1 bacterium]MDZ7414385.1 V-type ATP synthase subunit D [candidate division KSB1 bacterium]